MQKARPPIARETGSLGFDGSRFSMQDVDEKPIAKFVLVLSRNGTITEIRSSAAQSSYWGTLVLLFYTGHGSGPSSQKSYCCGYCIYS